MNSHTTLPRTSPEERVQPLLMGWRLGLVTTDEVFTWIDDRVLEAQRPGAFSDWFLALAEHGPDHCFKLSSRDFDFEWPAVGFREEFLSEVYLALRGKRSLAEFVEWVSYAAMGEDLDDPAVCFGYEMEDLLCDWDRRVEAVAEAERRLPGFAQAAETFVTGLRSEMDAPGAGY